jgi:2TM domain
LLLCLRTWNRQTVEVMSKEAVMDEKVVDRAGPVRPEDQLREEAVTDLRKRRELAGHVIAFAMVNTFLVIIWYVSGAGFFWPVFPIFGWGIGLVFHAWDVLWPQPSETAVRNAMDRISRRR